LQFLELLRKKLIQLSSHHFDHHSDFLPFAFVKTFPAISEMYHFGIVLGKLVDDFNSLHIRLAFRTAKGSAFTSFFPGGLGLGCSKWVWNPLSNLGHRGFLEISFSDPISTGCNFQQNGGDLSQFSPPKTMVLIRSTGKFNMEAQIQHHKLKLKTHQPNHLLTTSTLTNLSDGRMIHHPCVQKVIPFSHSKLVSPIHPKEPKEQKHSLKPIKINNLPCLVQKPSDYNDKVFRPELFLHSLLVFLPGCFSKWSKNAAGVKVKSFTVYRYTQFFPKIFTSEPPNHQDINLVKNLFLGGEREGGFGALFV